MSQITLYIATSLDGFIARKNNSLDWLYELPVEEGQDHGYGDLIAQTDVVVLGRSTYEEILGFGVDWPYADQTTYVVTSQKEYKASTENTKVLNSVDDESIDFLKSSSKKGIWLVGGGQLITEFVNQGAIDNFVLTMIPRILGDGIRLFPGNPKETKLELVSAESFNSGAVNLTYKLK